MRVMVTSRTIGAVIAFAAAGGAIVVAGRAIVGGHFSSSRAICVAGVEKCRHRSASQLVTDRGAFPLFGRCPAGNLETRHRVNIREEEDADVCQLWMRNPRRQAW
jgi:hypothetical protein